MANPRVQTSVADQASPVADLSSADVLAIVGVAPGCVANQVYTFGDPTVAASQMVSGPARELAAYTLTKVGGSILFVAAAADGVGTNGAVTHSGTGPVVTLTGVPTDSVLGLVTIRKGGTVGTATFTYSKDEGRTQSSELVTASTYVIPGTGITLNFAAGTYVFGETYAWVSVEPTASSANISTALTALFASGIEFGGVYICGLPQGATDSDIATASASLSTALQGVLDAQATAERWFFAMHEIGHVAQNATGAAALVTAYASVNTASGTIGRVAAIHGFGWYQSAISGAIMYRPAGWGVFNRLRGSKRFSTPAHEVDTGALAMVTPLIPAGHITPLEWDESKATVDLDAARLVTLTTIPGRPATAFITRPRLLGPPGTSFDQIQLLRVMNEACRQNRIVTLRYLNTDELVTNPLNPDGSGGGIEEKQAHRIEGAKRAFLLPLVAAGHCLAIAVEIDRAWNMLSSRKMKDRIRIRPKQPIENIDTELAFDSTLAV